MINYVLPLMFFSVTTFTANVTGLFRSAVLASLPLLILLIRPVNFKKYKLILILFSTILLMYTISWLVNDQSYANFLFGAYNRNLGFLSLLGLFLLTILSAEYYHKEKFKLVNSMYTLLILSIIYGVMQYSGLDPITWDQGAGKGSMLGNINFSSALFGMLSAVPLVRAITTDSFLRIIHAIIYFVSIYFIILSGSSQGFIISLAILLFVLIVKRQNLKNFPKSWRNTFIILTIASVLVILQQILTNSKLLLDLIGRAGQIPARIEHWKLGIRIFMDYPFTGVGIENMARYAGEYRSQEIRNWGNYILPDKSHNVVIDFFATGGGFVGVSWLIITTLTLLSIVNLLFLSKKQVHKDEILIFSCVWLGYFMQSLISTDSLLLITCGMMAAGALLGIRRQESLKTKQ